MPWLEAIVLGIVQGLTEFLPISSSAHLLILSQLFGWDDPGAAFTAVTQIGTEAAVVIYFRREIGAILRAWTRSLTNADARSDPDARMGWLVIIGTIPIAVLGVLFKDQIETVARNLWLVAANLIIFGLILGVADAFGCTGQDREGPHRSRRGPLRTGAVTGAHPGSVPVRRVDLSRAGHGLHPRLRGPLRIPAGYPGRVRIGTVRGSQDR